jgi:hypothetical protein
MATTADAPGLTPEQVAQFERDGYLLLPGWLSDEDMAAMRASAAQVIRDTDSTTVSVFTTAEQTRTTDDHFLGSGDKVRLFFEEGAFNADGTLARPKDEAVNKIGHNMHELLPPFRKVSLEDARIAGVCRSLGYAKPLVVQSMCVARRDVRGAAHSLRECWWRPPLLWSTRSCVCTTCAVCVPPAHTPANRAAAYLPPTPTPSLRHAGTS